MGSMTMMMIIIYVAPLRDFIMAIEREREISNLMMLMRFYSALHRFIREVRLRWLDAVIEIVTLYILLLSFTTFWTNKSASKKQWPPLELPF